MNRRGLTLIELVVVIMLIGTMVALAVPRIAGELTRQSVRSARTLFVAMHARTRVIAIQRSSQTQLVINNGQLTIRSFNPVTGVAETVGNVEDLGRRYGVTLAPTTLTLTFDARGIGKEPAQTTLSITKGLFTNWIVISAIGRIQK